MSASNWLSYRFGEFLEPRVDPVVIHDDVEYAQVTVQVRARGLKLRGMKIGSEIGTKRQDRVHPGQWVMSKIDARNGAFGMVPPSLAGAIVTKDFPIFAVDPNVVSPSFFSLYTSQPSFWDVCGRASRGTTNRKRLNVKIFLAMSAAVPPMEEQLRIVDLVEALDEEAAALQANMTAVGQFRNSLLAALLSGTVVLPQTYDRFLVRNDEFLSVDPTGA